MNRLNTVMKDLLDSNESVSVSDEFEDFNFKVVDVDSIVVFESYKGSLNEDLIDHLKQHTAVECFINKVNVEDHIATNGMMAQHAMKFADILSKKLSLRSEPFSIVVSVSPDLNAATVRFHVRREGESFLDEESIEFESREAIAILKVN